MVPKPYIDTEYRPPSPSSFTSSYSSFDGDKGRQRVLGIYGRNHESDNGYMTRKRVHEGYFIPFQGLVGHNFWHIYDADVKKKKFGDRAVLLQSIQNYRKVSLANFKKFPSEDKEVVQDPRFGEQVIVDCDDDICLGDVYEVTDSTLKLRVTAPRKTTRELDIKNKTQPGLEGICHLVTGTALAGWFCEVLCEGSMSEGSDIVLIERPLPQWTLSELAKAIYGGEGDLSAPKRCKPSWGRSIEELEELLAVPYFAECGWKQKLRTIKCHDIEMRQTIPYFTADSSSVASVLGVYGRSSDLDEYMPRSQVPSATFVPVKGIKGHSFWHDYDEDFKKDYKIFVRNQRAVLVQSIQNYRRIMESDFDCFPCTDMQVILDPCFGEQLIIDCPGDICVGDVFAVTGSTARFRVTSPRKPCSEIDNKNHTVYGRKGLRIFTLSTAMAGFFCSVESEGKVEKGSQFKLVDRPFPKWTLAEVATAIYGGEGDEKARNRGTGSWGRSLEELHELLKNPYLAEIEFKDELRAILRKIERKNKASVQSSAISLPNLKFEFKSAWIPMLLAFMIATISGLMVMGQDTRSMTGP
eukprot:CAMPEP_0194215504 /NCGR_PEP_ID=MMETSP0156-20130528/17361_1 /TAXON_ID=33649 /ORGANISM="Thalassionema nitzschioides, Strain L26-B" /LENGTH=580 /DNA_ID=CAMNT_0038944033 /DNA_START=93 /DNA_END=1835 /DNA_ORIENTATION=+